MRESRSVSCALPPPDPTFPSTGSELFMPKNTTFLYMPILTQRNPALWGEDADRFDPERWLAPERIAKFASNPMMYTPFSAGPRVVSCESFFHRSRVTTHSPSSASVKIMLITRHLISWSDCYSSTIISPWILMLNLKRAFHLRNGPNRAREVGRLLRRYGQVSRWLFISR